MKRPFIDELMELCEGRGYIINSVDVDGEVVEVIFNTAKKKSRGKDSPLQPDLPEIKENM